MRLLSSLKSLHCQKKKKPFTFVGIRIYVSESRLYAKYSFRMLHASCMQTRYSWNLLVHFGFFFFVTAFIKIACLALHDFTVVSNFAKGWRIWLWNLLPWGRKFVCVCGGLRYLKTRYGRETYFMYLHIIKNNFLFNRSLLFRWICFVAVYIRIRWLSPNIYRWEKKRFSEWKKKEIRSIESLFMALNFISLLTTSLSPHSIHFPFADKNENQMDSQKEVKFLLLFHHLRSIEKGWKACRKS